MSSNERTAVMTNEEQLLVESVQRGEMPAFQELVEKYKQKVYYMALDMTGNHHDAEDLSQEVFIKVFASIKDFRGDSKLSSWLYRIAMNTCIDKTRRKRLKLVELDEKVVEKPSAGGNPQRELEARSTQKQIDQALQKLPPRQRCIFAMRHYNEMMLREIAEVLKISEGTVKAQLFRAIRRLQKDLGHLRPDRMDTNEAM
jgi:RNA polymerase sigma-70 factor (ECF subfamily)